MRKIRKTTSSCINTYIFYSTSSIYLRLPLNDFYWLYVSILLPQSEQAELNGNLPQYCGESIDPKTTSILHASTPKKTSFPDCSLSMYPTNLLLKHIKPILSNILTKFLLKAIIRNQRKRRIKPKQTFITGYMLENG